MINHVSSNEKGKVSFTAKQLAFCAVAMALAFVLSNIKVFKFPTGGSITAFSMLVACLPGFFFGPLVGIVTGVAYGLLNLIVDPYILFPAQVIVDYILAFGALGLSGFFSNQKFGLVKGYVVAVLGRYVFAVLSGWIFFGEYAWDGWNPLAYSLVYNAIYIFAEAGVTLVVLFLPPVRTMMKKLKDMATN
ncbi:thiamine transporter [Pseudobutyrivibrio sp. YE44]|uniref:energy-coupled thiamine transporter ThiT n=1 Tax=Pseudobutyrivibrio sp. YE44 TaxID=1520802 RepID=UPI00088783AE|nr:energy-coupled thiamine transporter ThiT [Pseudobutyrivibrio sp. YE44]SDB46237.1 thiamine transporter [Pseudobutyrivibrio sp. YE44]